MDGNSSTQRNGNSRSPPTQAAPQARRDDDSPPFWQYQGYLKRLNLNTVRFYLVDSNDDPKFGSQLAGVYSPKNSCAYIDSGATYHFFHSTISFIHYERIDEEQVKAASSTTCLVGEGHVFIMLNKGLVI